MLHGSLSQSDSCGQLKPLGQSQGCSRAPATQRAGPATNVHRRTVSFVAYPRRITVRITIIDYRVANGPTR
jgi:hypothetical protein